MSASRKRMLGAIAASAAMVVLAACGGDGDKGRKHSSDRSKKPTASSTKDRDDSTETTAPAEPTFGQGLVVARCYVQNGVLKLELNDYKVSTSDTLGQKIIDWQTTDLNTSSVGGCGGRHMKAGYSDDYSQLFVSRFDSASDTYVIGVIDMATGTFTQLTKPSTQTNVNKSEVNPSYHGGRVYFYDASGDEPVLMSMKPDATDIRDESALQKKYDDAIFSVNDERHEDPYLVPGIEPTVIAEDANDETAYTADGSTRARMEASGPVSITKGGKTIEYNWDAPGDNSVLTVAGQHRMGGFLDDGSLIFSDGAQIYRGTPAGDKLNVSVVFKNNTKNTVDDLMLAADGKSIAFTFQKSDATSLMTLPVAGGEYKLLTDFPRNDLQGSVRILEYASK